MSEKKRRKKDGQDTNKKNQRMREANSDEQKTQAPQSQTPDQSSGPLDEPVSTRKR